MTNLHNAPRHGQTDKAGKERVRGFKWRFRIIPDINNFIAGNLSLSPLLGKKVFVEKSDRRKKSVRVKKCS